MTISADVSSSGTENDKKSVIPVAGTLSNFTCVLVNSPGGGSKTFTYAVRINGADSGITCDVVGAATTCSDNTHTAAVAVGDMVDTHVTFSNSPNLAGAGCAMKYTITAAQPEQGITTTSTTVAANNTFVAFFGGGRTSSSTTENDVKMVSPTAGTIKNMIFKVTVAPGAGTSRTMTLRQNGSNTALTCTISNAATSCTDTSDTVTIAVGDILTWTQTQSGSPAASTVTAGVEFDPSGGTIKSVLMGATEATISLTDGEFDSLVSNFSNQTNQLVSENLIPMAATIQNLQCAVTVAPGSGHSLTFTVRKNGSNQTETCQITNASTTCSDATHTFSVVAGDYIDLLTNQVNAASTHASCGVEVKP